LLTVLPFAADVQPAVTSELERTVYLQLTEGDFKVPGWRKAACGSRSFGICIRRGENASTGPADARIDWRFTSR